MATTARLLSMLSILQSRPEISGRELAERLEVTPRTVRRDVDQLRGLGYAIEGRRGAQGSYALGSGGSAVPPLVLDRDEIVALAVCVRAAAGDSVAGIADDAERALAKLNQSLPPPARAQADALAAATLRAPTPGDEVDQAVLVTVSAACQTPERLHLTYRDGAGRTTERRIEPYRIVNVERRWYLVAHDLERRAWRTFRLDRVIDVRRTGHGVDMPDPPDAVSYVRESITTAPYRHRARVVVAAPIGELVEQISPRFGFLEALDEHTTRLTAGADDLEYVAIRLALLGLDVDVEEPAELRDLCHELGLRLQQIGAVR